MSHFETVWKSIESLSLHSVEPALELPLDLGRVFQLAWWASDDSRPAVLIEAAGVMPEIDWSRSMAEPEQHGSTARIGIADSGARWEHLNVLSRISALLSPLPDGSEVELAISGRTPMRARGVLTAGRWRLTGFYPALPQPLLARALELSRQAQEEEFVEAVSVEVAEAAEATLRSEWSITGEGDPRLERDGARIRAVCADGDNTSWNQMFAGHILVHDAELRKAFQLEERLAEISQKDEGLAALQSLGVQLAQGLGRAFGIVQGKQILAGKATVFHTSDIRQLAWLRPGEVESSDEELEQLGFRPLGDLTADVVVMRVYGCAERDCLAVVNATSERMYLREFFSRCGDGTCLTTSTLPFGEEKPKKRLFKQSLPACNFAELLQRHRGHLREKGWKPLDCDTDLGGVARWIDDYLVAWNS